MLVIQYEAACVLCIFWAHVSDFVTSCPFLVHLVCVQVEVSKSSESDVSI